MSVSDSAFSAAVDAGALSLVTSLAEDASDVLLQLNALELLEQVGDAQNGNGGIGEGLLPKTTTSSP